MLPHREEPHTPVPGKAKLTSTVSNPNPVSTSSGSFTFDLDTASNNTTTTTITTDDSDVVLRKRNFPLLELNTNLEVSDLGTSIKPLLIVQSPKTPTLSRKFKAVSLDSDPQPVSKDSQIMLEVASRDVFSMPNTPKKQLKQQLAQRQLHLVEFDDTGQKYLGGGGSMVGGNLKHFASNSSISGSQTLKTLPEIMSLQDFSDVARAGELPVVRIKAKGLLERRGSNASLTIDLGLNSTPSTSSTTTEPKTYTSSILGGVTRLNAARSVSNLNLSTTYESPASSLSRCSCNSIQHDPSNIPPPPNNTPLAPIVNNNINNNNNNNGDKRKSQTHLETCGNCTIYESVPSVKHGCQVVQQQQQQQRGGVGGGCSSVVVRTRCSCICSSKCRRKSLSNENLYVPPCAMCQSGAANSGNVNGGRHCQGAGLHCKGHRRACYPRQADLEASQLLSEDFKLHLQNIQYLQTAGSVLSIADLKSFSKTKLHQEFWEVPLNLQEKCLVSGSQTKNRYKGVIPNEHSRVHLPGQQTYIHANYIKGPDYTETNYIATQGPMHHTCVDFWEMVWANRTNCIVMLTQLVEKGYNKCELYFPLGKKATNSNEKSFFIVKTTKIQDKFTFGARQTHQKLEEKLVEFEELNEVTYGQFRIRFIARETLDDDCILRHLELTKQGSDVSRKIIHYWFANWQDHKMAKPEQVLNIATHLLEFLDRNNRKVSVNSEGNVSSRKNSTTKSDFETSGDCLVSKVSNDLQTNAEFVCSTSSSSKTSFYSKASQKSFKLRKHDSKTSKSNLNNSSESTTRNISSSNSVKTISSNKSNHFVIEPQICSSNNSSTTNQSNLTNFNVSSSSKNGSNHTNSGQPNSEFSFNTSLVKNSSSNDSNSSSSVTTSSSRKNSRENTTRKLSTSGSHFSNLKSNITVSDQSNTTLTSLNDTNDSGNSLSRKNSCENTARKLSTSGSQVFNLKSNFTVSDQSNTTLTSLNDTNDSSSNSSSNVYSVSRKNSCEESARKLSISSQSGSQVSTLKLPVVHCSAGIGRTGCFLAIINGMRQLRSNRNVDVLATLCSLRLNRGGMVQTAEQYELVHKVLSLYSDSIVTLK